MTKPIPFNAGHRTKSAMKGSLKGLARVASAARKSTAARSRILTYHSVGARDHEMNVTPEAFREQMKWLADNYSVVSVEDVLSGNGQLALTFDDGYYNNVVNAGPVLKELGLPATFYVVTGHMGGLLDLDYNLQTSTLMSWADAKMLLSEGFSIGGHTRTHPQLTACSPSQVLHEIEGCYADLARELGDLKPGFAYPFGSALDYNERISEVVRQAGFAYAISNRYGVHHANASRWDARRIWVDRSDSIGSFRAKVEGKLDALALLDSPACIRARRFVNRLLATG